MSKPTLFSPEDLTLIRRPAAVLIVCSVIAAVAYLAVNYLNTSAVSRFQSVQSQYVQVQTSIQQIASEEATFVEYIDRYRMMEGDQVFADEDRLRLLESVQEIRLEGRLYPVTVEVDSQSGTALSYPADELLPGQPVELRYSTVSLEFSSLHEEDFARVITEFLRGPGLFLPIACLLDSVTDDEGFVKVEPNMNVSCELIWFTLNLNPVVSPDAV
jgi:hypothetical protein